MFIESLGIGHPMVEESREWFDPENGDRVLWIETFVCAITLRVSSSTIVSIDPKKLGVAGGVLHFADAIRRLMRVAFMTAFEEMIAVADSEDGQLDGWRERPRTPYSDESKQITKEYVYLRKSILRRDSEERVKEILAQANERLEQAAEELRKASTADTRSRFIEAVLGSCIIDALPKSLPEIRVSSDPATRWTDNYQVAQISSVPYPLFRGMDLGVTGTSRTAVFLSPILARFPFGLGDVDPCSINVPQPITSPLGATEI